jgi:multidrug efflux pump subunit AcrA (membrane-fusion protein)
LEKWIMTATAERSREIFTKTAEPDWTASRPQVVLTRSQAGRLQALPPSAPHSWKAPQTVSLALAAVVAASVSWKLWTTEPVAATVDHANEVKTVAIARPTPAAAGSVVVPATFRPWQTATLHARVSGYLTAWHSDLGAEVKAGELLAEIETPELDQELAEGEALALEASAAAVQAKAERAEARADLKVAEAQLVRIQAENALAKSQLERREKLLASRAVSRDDYDTFATQVESRTAEVAAAHADVVRRRTNLETRAAIIQAREATAKSRRANVDRLKELQVFKRIVAPFDGVVTRRAAEVGMLVTAGKESLFTVEDMSRVRVQMNVPQAYATQVRPGLEAMIRVPESALPVVRGPITRVAESIDSTNRTMLAEIELVNAAHRYQPGSYAQVTLTTEQDSTAWTVPTNTVHMRVDGPHVAVVNQQNRVELKHVVLGRDLGNRVVVADGIRGDERLVVNPGDSLASGTPVEVGGNDPEAQVAQR